MSGVSAVVVVLILLRVQLKVLLVYNGGQHAHFAEPCSSVHLVVFGRVYDGCAHTPVVRVPAVTLVRPRSLLDVSHLAIDLLEVVNLQVLFLALGVHARLKSESLEVVVDLDDSLRYCLLRCVVTASALVPHWRYAGRVPHPLLLLNVPRRHAVVLLSYLRAADGL